MRRGFTLIEAVLALVIFSGAVVACLQVRAQVLLSGERQREIQRADRAEEALFQMLVNNALSEPRLDEDRGVVVWEGTYLGEEYEIERWGMVVENPMYGRVGYEVSPRVSVNKYVIRFAGRESEVVWHR